MKIFVISPYPPKEGGLSVYSKRNVDYLRNLRDVEVMVHPFNSMTSWMFIFKLLKFNPDFVRIEYNIPAYGFGTLLLIIQVVLSRFLIKNTKYLVHYHEVKRETDLLGVVGKLFYKYFSKIFDGIFVHTNEAKNILLRVNHSMSQITYSVPLGTYSPISTNILPNKQNNKNGINKKFVILYFGYIHPDKGIEYLLKAISKIKSISPSNYQNLQVIIAGGIRERNGIFKIFERKDIQYLNSLKKLTILEKIGEHITFTGRVKENDINRLLSSCDIVVLPYLNVEQSGVLNMVLTYGKPIIASNIGGLYETLESFGILVNPMDSVTIANEIIKLSENKIYYEKYSQNINNLAGKLNHKNIMNETLSIYKSL